MDMIRRSANTEITALCHVPNSATMTVITAITAIKITPITVQGKLLIFSLSCVFFIKFFDRKLYDYDRKPPRFYSVFNPFGIFTSYQETISAPFKATEKRIKSSFKSVKQCRKVYIDLLREVLQEYQASASR